MDYDADLYIHSVFQGFFPLDVIEAHFDEYRSAAEELSHELDWDEVLLYAVYQYEPDGNALLSADFMLLRMPYQKYSELAEKISSTCRLFFFRSRQEELT